jgi:hypothetical protein
MKPHSGREQRSEALLSALHSHGLLWGWDPAALSDGAVVYFFAMHLTMPPPLTREGRFGKDAVIIQHVRGTGQQCRRKLKRHVPQHDARCLLGRVKLWISLGSVVPEMGN